MSLPSLTIVPAGAGSGKTYMIQDQLGKWIVEGKISPERIVAVTFTKAAAAELRERIRAKLLNLGRLEDALKLDQAYISTIHGFGQRLLAEFAFDAGLSPQPRLLTEDEGNALVRQALAQTDKANVITKNLARYGYQFDFNSKRSAEDVFKDDLLAVISLLRSSGWTEKGGGNAEQAIEWVRHKYGQTKDGETLTVRLSTAVRRLLGQFPENMVAGYARNKAASKAFNTDYRNLCAARDTDDLWSDWSLWKNLRNLRLTKPTPDGYAEYAEEVISAANALPTHPGPLQQATTHIEALLTAGQDILFNYAEAKREAGLVDYSDMIALAGDVLRNRSGVLDTLVSRIDCLVVDEFQDTNPLQFALLWQLKEAGIPTVLVGDLKQAIMGFQGADPRLFEALIQQNSASCEPLVKNWRSQSQLMEFINAVGPGLFGDAYEHLEPQLPNSQLKPLEVIQFSERPKKDAHKIRAAALGQRLLDLFDDPEELVEDKRSKQLRPLRGGDIAVLCPTHPMLAQYAAVLRGYGLRVRLQEDGWFTSRVVQVALHALAYLANPADRHAALYLSVTELGSLGLEDALFQLMDKEAIIEPVLEALDNLAPGIADRTVYALVADMLSDLNLYTVVSTWPDSEQARANLLRLQAEAAEFMGANREALATGGFHGSGIQSFLAWLDVKVEQNKGDNQPDPRDFDEDAIELVTWHSSKGREWPVVAVCGMERTIPVKLPKMSLGYSSFDDLSQLVQNTHIEISQKFAAVETNDKFLNDLQAAAEIETRRLLYVAMTRPKDKLILEWPDFLAEDKFTSWSILTEKVGLSLVDDELRIDGNIHGCIVTEGGVELPEDLDLGVTSNNKSLSLVGHRAIQKGQITQLLTPDNVTPSGLKDIRSESPSPSVKSITYSQCLEIDMGISGAELGTFLHHCFEVLGSNPRVSGKLAEITGVDVSDEMKAEIISHVSDFERWLLSYFSPIKLIRELPILSMTDQHSVISGMVDLIVETDAGIWIIDHKSDFVSDPESAFEKYRPQLDSYANALVSAGKVVLGTGINWIRKGEVFLSVFD